MVPLFALALTLTTAYPGVHLADSPHRARLLRVVLLTQEQLERAPVETLTLAQLDSEYRRLSDPPTFAAPAGMLAGGGALLILGALATWGCVAGANQARGWDVLGWVMLGVITAALAVVGAVLTGAGGVMLGVRAGQRSSYERRLSQVQARVTAIRSGQVPEPRPAPGETPQAQAELLQAEAEKPGLGLPIGLMIGGVAVGGYGAYAFAARPTGNASSANTFSPTVLGIGAIVVGLALEGIGIWQLISRLDERSALDAKAKQLHAPERDVPPPPPSVERLPPVPLLVAYGWRF